MSTLKVDTVQSTGGATIFTHSGGLFKPNALILQAIATNTDQSISADTDTKIEWETVVIDTGSYWDSTNHRYTPSVAGYYLCSGTIRSSANDVSKKQITWRKSGSSVLEARYQLTADYLTSNSLPAPTTLIQLNGSGDYIEIYFKSEEAMTVSSSDVPSHSEINIILVHAT
tara:strand:+ start:54 stop:566 length:513 start_codon:yes stop_codon:yes gene_type:complete